MTSRGVFFTLGMLFLASTLFSLALAAHAFSQAHRELLVDLLALDRVSALDGSIQNGFQEIFDQMAPVSITLDGYRVTFTENLPSDQVDAFNDALQAYIDFLEATYPEVDLNITLTDQELPLRITPNDVEFTHDDGLGQDRVLISPEDVDNIEAYYLKINHPSETFLTQTWGGAGLDKGSFVLNMTVTDFAGAFNSEQHLVDPEKTVTLNVDFTNNQQVQIKIERGEGGELRIFNDQHGSSIELSSTIQLVPLNEDIKVVYGEGRLLINLTAFEILKDGPLELDLL